MAGRGPPRALVAALALLAAAAPLGAGPSLVSAQGTLNADVRPVEVQPGTPRVGVEAPLAALVRNEGPNDALTFNVTFVWNGTETLRTLGYPADAANFTDQAGTGPPPPECLAASTGLRRNCTVGVRFGWTPPADHAGPGTITVRVAVGSPVQDPVAANDALDRATFVERRGLALALDPRDDNPKSAPAGKAAFYRLEVRNTGNVDEPFAAQLEHADGWPGSGLVANGTDAPAANVTLPVGPNATGFFLAVLVAPEGGTAIAPRVVVEGAVPGLARGERVLPATSVGGAAGWAFTADSPGTLLVPRGGSATATPTARNGAAAEDAVHWVLDEPLPAGWNASFAAAWVVLDGPAGTATAASLTIAADAALPPGSSATAALRATSFNGQATARVNLTLATPASDLALVGLSLQRGAVAVPLEDVAVYRGDVLDLRATVRNLGSEPLPKPARVVLEVRAAGQAPVSVAEHLVGGLAAGEPRDVFLRWDTGDHSGAVEVAVRADPEGSVPELREDNNDLARNVTVRLHGLAVAAPPARTALPGQELAFAGGGGFEVRNLGNAPERVLVQVRTPRGWANATHALDLAAGASAVVEAAVAVPAFPGTAEEPLVAEASLANRSATVAANATPIRIDDREPPVLESLEGPATAPLGVSTPFRAVLRDAVGIARAALHVRLPDGALRNASMASEDGVNWTAFLVLTQPGPATYWVVAVDATPANHTLDTSGTPRGLLVEVAGAPAIDLREPRNNSAIRPGVQVKLRVTDVHGITSVAVRDGARTFEIQEPYTIDTSGWTEGEHRLEITARNGFGNTATALVVVHVDGTPPPLRDVRTQPARPAPGQEVRVEARAGDATEGSVAVVRASGEVVQVARASVGIGLLTANFTAPAAGSYHLGLRAVDAAGNEATVSVPLVVSGGLPGPGALAVLALLAVAAWAARRRR